MADTVRVHDALVAYLAADAALLALCPDGVWWSVPPQGATAVVVVVLIDHRDQPGIDATTLYERSDYLVKAMHRLTGGAMSHGAAARIDELLHHAELDLSAAGYQAMVCRRIEHFAPPLTIDPANQARWRQEGGRYELLSHPAA